MSFLTPVWNYVDGLVHPSEQQDALTAARHRVFIAAGTQVAVRLPIDCEGARPAVEPIKLVTARGREFAAAASIQAKKSG